MYRFSVWFFISRKNNDIYCVSAPFLCLSSPRFSVWFFISRKNNDMFCVSLSFSSGYSSRGKEEKRNNNDRAKKHEEAFFLEGKN